MITSSGQLRALQAITSEGTGPRPEIVTTDRRLRDMTEDALRALDLANQPPRIFCRGLDLVRVVVTPEGTHQLQTLEPGPLRCELERCAEWLKVAKNGDRHPVPPPNDVVTDLMSLADVGGGRLPRITGLIEAPALRPDGSIITAPGFDSATGLYYADDSGLTVPAIPEQPTAEDVHRAMDVIEDVLCDFPFESPSAKAAAYGLLITAVVRPALKRAPMCLLDATKQGTGKGLLANVVSLIATGREAAAFSAPDDEAEWRKSITSMLLAGSGFVLIDNVDAHDWQGNPVPLRSPALSAVLTTGTHSDRILGRSQMVNLPAAATWCCTGNNVQVAGDLIRRCYRIRLDAHDARPWLREGFRHPQLLEYVDQHRGQLLAALLTMCRGWYAAGCPAPSMKLLGSFEDWTRMVGGILELAGISGFLGDLEEVYENADSETPEWTSFLANWHEVIRDRWLTVGELVKWMTEDEDDLTVPAEDRRRLREDRRRLRESLPGDLIDRIDDKGFTRSLGHAFKGRRGTRHGDQGLYLTHRDDPHTKQLQWRVLAAADDSAGFAGFGGVSDLTRARTITRAPARGPHKTPQNPANPARSVDHDFSPPCPRCESADTMAAQPDGWCCPHCGERWGQSAEVSQ